MAGFPSQARLGRVSRFMHNYMKSKRASRFATMKKVLKKKLVMEKFKPARVHVHRTGMNGIRVGGYAIDKCIFSDGRLLLSIKYKGETVSTQFWDDQMAANKKKL